MKKIFVSTAPFSEFDRRPVDILSGAGIELRVNPTTRKMSERELIENLDGVDVLIAGTERITSAVFEAHPSLRMISRVGIGLDGIDIHAAVERGVKISYTPDAPSPAVAELTIGLIITLLRGLHIVGFGMRSGRWARYQGGRLAHSTIGVIGVGRIGSKVVKSLKALGAKKILVNDVRDIPLDVFSKDVYSVSKDEIYSEADVISIHVPLTKHTKGMIDKGTLAKMKPDALLINTARGGIICEHDLTEMLRLGHLGGVALDVFEQEPYCGDLGQYDRCILTSHLGSMTKDCRARMELEAVEEAVRFIQGRELKLEVPYEEYI